MADGTFSSVITQVSRENGGSASALIKSDDEDTDQRTDGDCYASGPFSGKKKSRTRDFVRLFCCCFCPSEDRSAQYTNNIGLVESGTAPNALLAPSTTPGKKTLVLDLDETLVHSSFKPIPDPHFVVPVEIEDQIHKVYVLKRPGVDEFLAGVGDKFEVVIFTASLAKYADPVLDLLDQGRVIRARLFREACSNYKGNYVKDLNVIGRELKNTIIVDNSPSSYLFHPENAIPCGSWFDDETDTELPDMLELLDELSRCDNVRTVLQMRKKEGLKHLRIPEPLAARV